MLTVKPKAAENLAVTSDNRASLLVKPTRRLLTSLIALMAGGLLVLGMMPLASADFYPADDIEVTEEEVESVEEEPAEVLPEVELTLLFDANGGSAISKPKIVLVGQPIGVLPTPSRINYTFKGWYTDKTEGERVLSTTIVTEEFETTPTLYARWLGKSVKIQFDPKKGKVSNVSIKVNYGSAYGKLPTPKRAGYQFVGWYTKASGGTKITATSKVKTTATQKLYARWQIPKYKVTFDAGKGTNIGKKSKTVQYKAKYGPLPSASRSGYRFVGWYNASGTKILATTQVKITKNVTLSARWVKLQTKADHWVNVDLKKLTATLMDGDAKVAVFPISPGKPSTPTIKGTFRIYSKVKEQSMGGYSHVKWCSWFKGNYGFHTAYWHNNFGKKAVSHGCVNMRLADAKKLFDWVKLTTIVEIK